MPDRGPDQQADPRRADPPARGAHEGRLGVPVLRRRLRADLPCRRGAQRDLVRRGPRAAGLAEAAVREGPLRLGLRRITAAPDRAADPARGSYPKGAAVGRRASGDGNGRRKPGGLVDYDEVCRTSARRAGRRRSTSPPRRSRTSSRARPRRDRRLRLGQVLERGGLPLPEADPRGLRHEQRRPLHAPLPRLERRGAVRGRRLRRGLDDLRRHHQRRRRDHGRHQHHREPPGRVARSSSRRAGAAPS